MSVSALGVSAVFILAMAVLGGGSVAPPDPPEAGTSASYDRLLTLFREWREFQKPRRVGGVPDYSAVAMAAQKEELESWKRRLAAIDPAGWPIPRQVDYQLVRAEMSGLEFDHRVLKPWADNPAFYVTVFTEESDQPAREGPVALGAVELWKYPLPSPGDESAGTARRSLSTGSAAELEAGLRAIPDLLAQAKRNLTGNAADLWSFGAKSLRQQSADLTRLEAQVRGTPANLPAEVVRARKATDDFVAWVEARLPSKTGPSGIGVDNYDWYLKHVQLVPYTWKDEVTLMERELARAHALLAMEERRNAKLPQQAPIATADEHARRFGAAVTDYMAFLKDHEILSVRGWMDAALRARIGAFSPGPREFFGEIDYRDPEVMRTHGYHWFDKGVMKHEPNASPIRRGALLYNIFNTRTEGHATGWEELMMQAGMFDARPRSRELVYILVAERAARALGDLRMHSREQTLEEASAFACAHTPRGWLSMTGNLVRGEQHLYVQQPGYGTSYLIGKIEIEKLLAERRRELGDAFTLKRFMDELDAAGLIPASLLRWELTGRMTEDVRRMLAPEGR